MSASAAPVGILLINLGTPDAPTPEAVRAYLKEFLSDPRIVEIPRAVWLPILYLFILRRRPKASAERYRQVWTRDGSPLRVYTERQAAMVTGYLGDRLRAPLAVEHAMRYGKPSIAGQLEKLIARGCERILLVPLYPQFAASTTATAFDAAFEALSGMRNQPEIRTIRGFHDDPGYIAALEATVRDYWMKHGKPDGLVMSFHGIPERSVERGDPYQAECEATGRLLAQALGLNAEQYAITFQSRFGRAEWLKPYTADVLTALGKQRPGRIDVICPGFVSDCLETLEEIAIEGKAIFQNAGGGDLRYIPALNDRHEWVNALCDLIQRNLEGWISAPAPAPQISSLTGLSTSAHA